MGPMRYFGERGDIDRKHQAVHASHHFRTKRDVLRIGGGDALTNIVAEDRIQHCSIAQDSA